LYHSAPLRFALVTLLRGGVVVLPGGFDAARFAAACAAHRATTTFLAPTQLGRLRGLLPGGSDGVLASLRLLAHAGAPCPDAVKRWALGVLSRSGCGSSTARPRGSSPRAAATSGWRGPAPWAGHARTAARRRRRRPDLVHGAAVRAVHLLAGPGTDGGRLARADAFTVGDAGHLDADGYLHLLGRRDDLVISGGVNVYPAEVERVLGELPGVTEVAAFGVADDGVGAAVEVAVVGSVDERAVLDHARGSLPPARRPKRVHVVDDLPRTSTGKVLRRELPDLLPERLNQARRHGLK
jgi:long-chain acyl-CoA synthetase